MEKPKRVRSADVLVLERGPGVLAGFGLAITKDLELHHSKSESGKAFVGRKVRRVNNVAVEEAVDVAKILSVARVARLEFEPLADAADDEAEEEAVEVDPEHRDPDDAPGRRKQTDEEAAEEEEAAAAAAAAERRARRKALKKRKQDDEKAAAESAAEARREQETASRSRVAETDDEAVVEETAAAAAARRERKKALKARNQADAAAEPAAATAERCGQHPAPEHDEQPAAEEGETAAARRERRRKALKARGQAAAAAAESAAAATSRCGQQPLPEHGDEEPAEERETAAAAAARRERAAESAAPAAEPRGQPPPEHGDEEEEEPAEDVDSSAAGRRERRKALKKRKQAGEAAAAAAATPDRRGTEKKQRRTHAEETDGEEQPPAAKREEGAAPVKSEVKSEQPAPQNGTGSKRKTGQPAAFAEADDYTPVPVSGDLLAMKAEVKTEAPAGPAGKRRKKRVTEASGSAVRLRVMSFNILAEWAAAHYRTELYRFVSNPAFLSFAYRWRLLKHEIERYDPDIIALQEVDRWEEVRVFLLEKGYHAEFAPKLKETDADGVVLAWKKDRLHKRHTRKIPLRNDALAERYAKPQVGLFGEFAFVGKQDGTEKRVLVAVAHIYFAPPRGDVKKVQTDVLLQQTARFVNGGSITDPLPPSVPACPELESAWHAVRGREPAYTTSHNGGRSTTDYIFTCGCVSPVAAQSPTLEQEQAFVGLPSVDHGSDHLPIVVDVDVSLLPDDDERGAILATDLNCVPESPLYAYVRSGGMSKYLDHTRHRNYSGLVDTNIELPATSAGRTAWLYKRGEVHDVDAQACAAAAETATALLAKQGPIKASGGAAEYLFPSARRNAGENLHSDNREHVTSVATDATQNQYSVLAAS
ncbi:Carbon catabolite repressor protein 4-like protein 3 [Diplonema papillatum]|nr:Carbon catabolite repressor protein 4-like protein 3 [Diplonema papillatum]